MLECHFFWKKNQNGGHLEIFECITSSQGKLQKLSNFQIILDSIFICYGYQAMQSQRQRECLFFWKKSKMAAKKPLSKIDRIFLIIFINRKSTQRHSTTKTQVKFFFFFFFLNKNFKLQIPDQGLKKQECKSLKLIIVA